ncbi:hypothetical protein AGABI1DRAFT_109956 [Agaricus bisporus var. burnettii JB137-S8]|uniref:Uncharacterized protein n=1 Tax=Agaricus bisporus var. burnettii (strain JB137-S8 / ATCC MYA-4627 / FGSC 10392) TaxID=597362 RepID=K5WUH4_AGABU|nr:uncharacterized protein AGABI1DRAFT_109956 [Agaricus bisporus var. burnettii JB137-S8]EKM74418.1 hypothetical protein AGABI1DRAFT_109956 [Agaricus bisporus var. burnettii JB137-S8]
MSLAECPRCGYHIATEFKEGIPALEAEVSRLEVLMSRLQEEKSILLRRINNAQEKTRRLPFEVLSNIFLFARPPIQFADYEPIFYDEDDPEHPSLTGYYDPDEDFHHTLAAVSHRWRQVALSTPQLWTSISLSVLNTFTEFNTSLLDLYFENAHSLPVSIQLDFSNPALVWDNIPSRRSDFLMRLEPLAKTIFEENADKPLAMQFRDDLLAKFGALLQFFLRFPGSSLTPTCNAVSSLHLSHTDLHKSIQLLVELPNLVVFEGICQQKKSLLSQSNFTEPIILHGLEDLTWDAHHIDDIHNFLRHVRFDNLRTLQWHEGRRHGHRISEEGEGLRLDFFSSLPSTLSSLIFDEIELDLPCVLDLLSCVPQLTELHFINYFDWVVLDTVKAIGRPFAEGTSSSPSTVLPNLCVLSISNAMFGGTSKPSVFLELLETLHATGPRPKRFHLITYSEVRWDSDALDKVRTLLSSGLDAKITFDVDGSETEIS